MQDLKYRFVIEFETIIPKGNHLNAIASITPDAVIVDTLKKKIIPDINQVLIETCKVDTTTGGRDLDVDPPVVIRICN